MLLHATATAMATVQATAMAEALCAFDSWLKSNGVIYPPEVLSIRAGAEGCGGTTVGVFAARDVNTGDLLAHIPLDAVLSAETSSIAELLKECGASGALALAMAVMHERSLGERSRWCVRT
jgi:SET domain-containing protein 6